MGQFEAFIETVANYWKIKIAKYFKKDFQLQPVVFKWWAIKKFN